MPSYQITTPDGQKFKITAETEEAASAAINDLLGSAPAKEKAAPQEMVGFGERGQREQDMPETPDVASERRIAQRMARDRKDFGAGDVFLQDYTLGLRDEAAGAGAGLAGMLHGRDFNEGYEESQIADQRLREEYAQKNPGKNAAASIGGLVTGGVGKAVAAPTKALLGLQTMPASMAARTTGQRIGEGLVVGGSQGAIHGAAEGDETGSRLNGALFEGTIGGVIGGGVPALIAGGRQAAQYPLNTYRSVTNGASEAAKRIEAARAKDLAAQAGMSDAEYAAAVASGKPVTLLDRGGENTQRLARSAADQSTEASQAMNRGMDERYATQSERLRGDVGSQSTLGMNGDDAMDAAKEAAKKANGPAYQKAMELGDAPIWDDTLEGLAQTPAMITALKKAVSNWRNRAALDPWMKGLRLFNPPVSLDDAGNIVFRNSEGLPSHPNLRLWDHAKRELDDMANSAMRSGNKEDAKLFGQLAKELRDHLDTQGAAGKAYQAARQGAASAFGAEDAYSAGKAFATQTGKAKMSARDAIKHMAKMKPEERKLFKEGYIQATKDRLAEVGNSRDAGLGLMASDGAAERARVALGKTGAEQLQAQIAVENAMNASRKVVQGGSKTNQYQQDIYLASAAGGGTALAGGDSTDMSVTGLLAAGTNFGRRKANANLAKHIGQLLASNDPKKIQSLIAAAAKSPRYLEIIQAMGAISPGLTSAGAIAATGAASQ